MRIDVLDLEFQGEPHLIASFLVQGPAGPVLIDVERFIRSMKQECTRCLFVLLSLAAIRREICLYAIWYNTRRPHMALGGKAPREVYEARESRPVEASRGMIPVSREGLRPQGHT